MLDLCICIALFQLQLFRLESDFVGRNGHGDSELIDRTSSARTENSNQVPIASGVRDQRQQAAYGPQQKHSRMYIAHRS